MPIEIKELHIKTVVDNAKKGESAKASPETIQVLVAQCVEQVMEILNQKMER